MTKLDGKEISTRTVKRQKTSKMANEADKCFMDYVTYKKASQNSNLDLEFLKSLLPDIAKMNYYQKRQFKKRTLDVIDSILCDTPLANTESYEPLPTSSPAMSNYSANSYITQHSPAPTYGEGTSFYELQTVNSSSVAHEATIKTPNIPDFL